MKINKIQFRWLLAGYFLFGVISVVEHFLGRSILPEAAKELDSKVLIQSTPLFILMLTFFTIMLGAALVGFIGMLHLSPRYVYLGALFMSILMSLLMMQQEIHTGRSACFCKLHTFFGGVILTLCLVGPATELFVKKKSNQRLRSIAGSAKKGQQKRGSPEGH